jgi:hypothetical protein
MPTGDKNEEGQPQGQPSSEHCSAEACDQTSRLALAPSLMLSFGRSWRTRGGVTGERLRFAKLQPAEVHRRRRYLIDRFKDFSLIRIPA